VSHYEAVQLKLIGILESGAILENLMEQFFDEKMKSPKQSAWKRHTFFKAIDSSKEIPFVKECGIPIQWASLLAYCFHGLLTDNIDEDKKALSSFIDGMREADVSENVFMIDAMWKDRQSEDLFSSKKFYYLGFKMWGHYKWGNALYSLNDVINALNQIKSFKEIPRDGCLSLHTCHILLHEYLYQKKQQIENARAEAILEAKYKSRPLGIKHEGWFYEPKVNGFRETVQENELVNLRFCIKNVFGINNLLYGNQVKTIPLAHAMRGFREGLAGLRRGSSGTLYIHPDYGFRGVSHSFGVKPFLIVDIEIQ